MTTDQVVKNLVRVGVTSDVDNDNLLCRVIFQDTGVTSGWLKVLRNEPFIPDYDTAQKTEEQEGGDGEAAFESHYHELAIKPWMPVVNQKVLVLTAPVFNGDGYVLGGVT